MTLMPRSWPSRPGLATTTRYGTLHGGHPKWMPVAQSDPRRATIVGIVGVVVGVVMIVVVLLANNLGSDRSTTQSSTVEVRGRPARSHWRSRSPRTAPLFFNDTGDRFPAARRPAPRRRPDHGLARVRRRRRLVRAHVGRQGAGVHRLQRTSGIPPTARGMHQYPGDRDERRRRSSTSASTRRRRPRLSPRRSAA